MILKKIRDFEKTCDFENNPGFVQMWEKFGILKNPGVVILKKRVILKITRDLSISVCGENQGFVDIGLIVDLEKDKSIKNNM